MNYQNQKLSNNLERSVSLISWMKDAAKSGDDCIDVLASGLHVLEQMIVQHIAETKKEAHAS